MNKGLVYIFLASAALWGCSVSKPQPVEQADPTIITGSVRDEVGKALEGVVVSDGVCVVKTDKKGQFEMPYDRASGRFVFVSTLRATETLPLGARPVIIRTLPQTRKFTTSPS